MTTELVPEHFLALWRRASGDYPPHPLQVTPQLDDRDDLARTINELERVFDEQKYEYFRLAARVLAEPEVYIEVFGEVLDQQVRVCAAQLGQYAAIAAEVVSGDGPRILLGVGGLSQFPERVIGSLPANAGGSRVFAPVSDDPSSGDEVPRNVLRDPWAAPEPASLQKAYERGRIGEGNITVYRGPRVGRKHLLGRLSWVDLNRDGRYLVTTRSRGEVRPGGPEVLARELGTLVAEGVQDFRDEEERGGW
ncbi:MAG: hypothetical protein GX542_13320 [Rhodococcus sp.]|nr:hypothetical protein [Rhodococcus sp. (in: high G+C Gram-positive bacteria)]